MIKMELAVSPSLSEESQRILRVMVQKPVIAGGELVILAHISSPEKLADALRPLLSAGVISTNTSIDPNEVLKSYFNLNPSARPFAEFATR
jgi:hypothetical protein